MSDEFSEAEAQADAEQHAIAEAVRKTDIARRLKLKESAITRMTANRVYVDHPGETTESLCVGCGGGYVRRGYCTNCGMPR